MLINAMWNKPVRAWRENKLWSLSAQNPKFDEAMELHPEFTEIRRQVLIGLGAHEDLRRLRGSIYRIGWASSAHRYAPSMAEYAEWCEKNLFSQGDNNG